MPWLQRSLCACALALAVAEVSAQAFHPTTDDPQVQKLTPAQLRYMTAAQFQKHLNREGAAAFTARAVKDIDPHSPEEPNYDIILEHIAEGSGGWLKIAAEIGPYTDPRFSEGLKVAVADALIANPTGVLRMIGREEHFDQACGYPFVHQTEAYLYRHQKAALAALAKVHSRALEAKKNTCQAQLMQIPVNTASGAQ